jgi:S-adenosylmethionine decarboxylase
MVIGTEWLIDASGCRIETLCDPTALKAIFDRVVADLNLQIVGETRWHQFPPPGGITGMALLSESHLACHTYPEHSAATFNLYCCRPRPEWPWAKLLCELLGAQSVNVRTVERNSAVDAAVSSRVASKP